MKAAIVTHPAARRMAGSAAIDTTSASIRASELMAAVGVNCSPPRLRPELIRSIQSATDKPIVVYPNSGERYDAIWRSAAKPSQPGQAGRLPPPVSF